MERKPFVFRFSGEDEGWVASLTGDEAKAIEAKLEALPATRGGNEPLYLYEMEQGSAKIISEIIDNYISEKQTMSEERELYRKLEANPWDLETTKKLTDKSLARLFLQGEVLRKWSAKDNDYLWRLPELVSQAIEDDLDFDGDGEMARFYNRLSVREKAVADVLLIRLCGWSLQTLMLCVEQKLPPGEVDGRAYDRYNPFTLLDGPISDDDLKPKK
jgi:hypothetical protein